MTSLAWLVFKKPRTISTMMVFLSLLVIINAVIPNVSLLRIGLHVSGFLNQDFFIFMWNTFIGSFSTQTWLSHVSLWILALVTGYQMSLFIEYILSLIHI